MARVGAPTRAGLAATAARVGPRAPPGGQATTRRIAGARAAKTEAGARAPPGSKKGFVEEMRFVAMRLHTKEQAPKEGKAEAPKDAPKKFDPTKEGYLAFLCESKVVYDAMESIMRDAPEDSVFARFQNTGLERSGPLAEDIKHLQAEFGLAPYEPAADGPGNSYAATLRELAENDPPAFVCHYYNVYFAHTAGGRMIGKMVSDKCLEGWSGAFYRYPLADGSEQTDEEEKEHMKELLGGVKATIDDVAESWSREEKDHCLEETAKSFELSGKLLRCIMS